MIIRIHECVFFSVPTLTDYVTNCIVKDETQFDVTEFVPRASKLTQDKLYGASSSD